MYSSIRKPLSIVHTKSSSPRVTKQTIQTLLFIHRFRQVTARQVQVSLCHAIVTTTYHQLTILCDKCYLAKRTDIVQRFHKPITSYYLTPHGLELLTLRYPDRSFRRLRSLNTDALMSKTQRTRYLTLADVYVHFKRHYNGHFEFFSSFDLLRLDYMPSLVPDGYVRTILPDADTQHYFIEIFGWGRSTQTQQHRLKSMIDYAESNMWTHVTGTPHPKLFIVVPSEAARKRLHAQLHYLVGRSSVHNFEAYTTTPFVLDSDVSSIWRQVEL